MNENELRKKVIQYRRAIALCEMQLNLMKLDAELATLPVEEIKTEEVVQPIPEVV
jgi:hypothetical protein